MLYGALITVLHAKNEGKGQFFKVRRYSRFTVWFIKNM